MKTSGGGEKNRIFYGGDIVSEGEENYQK